MIREATSSQVSRFAGMLMVFLVAISGGPFLVRAGDNTWSAIGLLGASVFAIAVDPMTPTTVYAVTDTVYKSADGGTSWIRKDSGIPVVTNVDRVISITVDPHDSTVLYAPFTRGLYRSNNGGDQWQQLAPVCSRSLAVSPVDENVLLLGSMLGGILPRPAMCLNGIYRSDDRGESWEVVLTTTDLSAGFAAVRQVAFSPSAPHIAYAVAEYAGVFRSNDEGKTWQPVNSAFAKIPSVHCLFIDPNDSQVVYICTSGGGIFKTTNGGATWTPIGTGLMSSDIQSIIVHPLDQQTLYVGAGSQPGSGIPGGYRSSDNSGLNFGPMMTGMGSRAIFSLAADLNRPANIYAGTINSGIWKWTATDVRDYSISVNNGALFTNRTDVTLTLTAPPGTTEMLLSNDGGFSDALWEPFLPQRTWVIQSIGAAVVPRTVYARFRTNGQMPGQYQDDIILDVTPPSGSVQSSATSTSRKIDIKVTKALSNVVYVPQVTRGYQPGYLNIQLLLSATDDVSGVDAMMIGNDESFRDARWQPFQSRVAWLVSAERDTVISVRFRDRAGNVSAVSSTTFKVGGVASR